MLHCTGKSHYKCSPSLGRGSSFSSLCRMCSVVFSLSTGGSSNPSLCSRVYMSVMTRHSHHVALDEEEGTRQGFERLGVTQRMFPNGSVLSKGQVWRS